MREDWPLSSLASFLVSALEPKITQPAQKENYVLGTDDVWRVDVDVLEDVDRSAPGGSGRGGKSLAPHLPPLWTMNRSTDFKILSENPEAAGDVAKAIRKGIVKGFLAVKNADKALSEQEIRRLHKIPDYMKGEWLANGTLLFACPGNPSILVEQDGGAKQEGS